MNPLLLVGVGGAVGALARYTLSRTLERDLLDTFAVNVLGSVLLGLLVTAPVGEPVTVAAGTGFCGAFTTFSSFAVETVQLAENDELGAAAGYAGGMLGAALVGVLVGSAVGAAL
ncbi:fluoride efflux transporter FluC [Halomicroarcula sp. GCM10025709]|uniref:fluoride efflux transporter FluC n=1 Tax=Haloarcula TaxID=2237 RepID=UPI0024C2E92B|nr:CrcB family protein [Halomicroarcula sp. YJ-61-S]